MSVIFEQRPSGAVLDFGGSVTAGAVDRVLINEYVTNKSFDDVESVQFDFRETIFSEPCAWQSIVAFTRTLLAQQKTISIRLPKQHKQRDFWRAWNYPNAIEVATGRSFRELSEKIDHTYFGEEQIFFRNSEIQIDPETHEKLAFLNHFPIYSAKIQRGQKPADIAYQFKNTWNASHVQDILRRKIGKNYGYFASRVVFEAILNAVRHPGASLIQTGAIDQPSGKKNAEVASHLNVHFWDNGASIADTLYKAIQRGVAVREGTEREFEKMYLLRYEPDLNVASGDNLIPFDFPLTSSTPQHVALLATLFPLVTSDPLGVGHEVDYELKQSQPRFALRGMGLFVLINTVVEIMHGEVSFRTSHFFMHVRKPDKKESAAYPSANLTARIRRFPSTSAAFAGNLLVARIPITNAHE